jgi:hypothetical protein
MWPGELQNLISANVKVRNLRKVALSLGRGASVEETP